MPKHFSHFTDTL